MTIISKKNLEKRIEQLPLQQPSHEEYPNLNKWVDYTFFGILLTLALSYTTVKFAYPLLKNFYIKNQPKIEEFSTNLINKLKGIS